MKLINQNFIAISVSSLYKKNLCILVVRLYFSNQRLTRLRIKARMKRTCSMILTTSHLKVQSKWSKPCSSAIMASASGQSDSILATTSVVGSVAGFSAAFASSYNLAALTSSASYILILLKISDRAKVVRTPSTN